jgi:ligand-binding sensor domain-containing protein
MLLPVIRTVLPMYGHKTGVLLLLSCLLLCGCEDTAKKTINLPLPAITCMTAASAVRDLAFGSAGAVWAATPGGLLKFNQRNGQYAVYTVASGLPSNNVLCVWYSTSGILWLGTDQGIASFDGERFTCFGAADGLLDQTATAFAEDGDGTLYAGTKRGIMRFTSGIWEPFNDSHEFARRPVRAIARDTDGSMWFVKEKALSHYQRNDTWEIYHKDVLTANTKVPPLFRYLLCIAVDSSGTKWIGSEHGLYGYDGSSWQWYFDRGRLGTGRGLKDNRIETVAPGAGKRIFVAHGDSPGAHVGLGMAFSDGTDQWTYLTTADGLPSNSVYTLKADAGHTIWAGTAQGLASVDGRHIKAYQTRGLMPDNHVIAMLADEGGRRYALLASGLVECMGKTIKELPAMPGKQAGAGIAVSGRIYAAGADKGLYVFTGSGNWEQDGFFIERKVLHLEKSDQGQVLAVAADGIYRGSSGNWVKVEVEHTPADFIPLKVFQDYRGKLWITGTSGRIQGGARSALVTVQNKQLVLLAVPSLSLSYAYLNRILFDHNNTAYLSGPAGLYQYSASGWQPIALPVARGSLSAAAWDKQGRLWIAGRDQGLFMRDGSTWCEFLFAGKSVPGGITSIAFENDAVVWLGTSNQGLFRVDVTGKTS